MMTSHWMVVLEVVRGPSASAVEAGVLHGLLELLCEAEPEGAQPLALMAQDRYARTTPASTPRPARRNRNRGVGVCHSQQSLHVAIWATFPLHRPPPCRTPPLADLSELTVSCHCCLAHGAGGRWSDALRRLSLDGGVAAQGR